MAPVHSTTMSCDPYTAQENEPVVKFWAIAHFSREPFLQIGCQKKERTNAMREIVQ